MKSLPGPPKISEKSSPVTMKSLPGPAEDQVEAAAVDDVVACLALDDVVAADVGDDVVAVAAVEVVVAEAALDPVVAAVAIERVVAVAGDEDVVAGRAAEHDVLGARVLEVVRVRARRGGIVADHQRREDRCRRIGIGRQVVGRAQDAVRARDDARLNCLRRVDLEDEGRRQEDERRQVRRVGVGHDQLGERVVLQLGEEVHARRCGAGSRSGRRSAGPRAGSRRRS